MKVAAIAAVCVFIVMPVEAGQRHAQNNVSPDRDDGRCTSLNVAAPTSSSGRQIRTSERKPHHAVDANGNGLMVKVQTAYGFNITVHPAYASKFQKFFALLKERGYKVPANITKCWGHRTARMSRAPTTTSVPPAIFRWAGIVLDFVYHMNDIVTQAGLYNGCTFRDCGHVEAVRGTHNRAPNLYATIEKFKSEQSTANYQP